MQLFEVKVEESEKLLRYSSALVQGSTNVFWYCLPHVALHIGERGHVFINLFDLFILIRTSMYVTGALHGTFFLKLFTCLLTFFFC